VRIAIFGSPPVLVPIADSMRSSVATSTAFYFTGGKMPRQKQKKYKSRSAAAVTAKRRPEPPCLVRRSFRSRRKTLLRLGSTPRCVSAAAQAAAQGGMSVAHSFNFDEIPELWGR